MSLYARMAVQNLRNNYRFFIPRILTEAGLLGSFYIVYTLACDERMRSLKGGDYLPSFMAIGAAVIALLSLILMLYTNSFLMKQRKREFGLYNVLGLEKRHIGKLLALESTLSSAAGIVLGILFGMLFYKLCSLLVCRLLGVPSVLGFSYISPKTILPSALGFALFDCFTYVVNRISIARMKPVELMASAHVGEREPRVRWLLLVLGVLCLGGGYALAVATTNPLAALKFFFIAVFLVIFGTYFLFIAGTTFVLQRLKRNERYYYSKQHMTAVSGLLYRMKQNAVGLASICILATGVLVMISTTVSLYAGSEDSLDLNYPQELYISASYQGADGKAKAIPIENLESIVTAASERAGLPIRQTDRQEYLAVAYAFENGVCTTERNLANWTSATYFFFMTADDYGFMTGEALDLKSDEIALCVINADARSAYAGETFTLGGTTYHIARYLPSYPINTSLISTLSRYGVVVSDKTVLNSIDRQQREAYGENCSEMTHRLCVSFSHRAAARENGSEIDREIESGIRAYAEAQPDAAPGGEVYIMADRLWDSAEGIYGMYGSFLFLGILLGLVCLFATALIIYYKQISEGYEDRGRYQIMEKIGMSQAEVKSSIRSQVLLVFFLPLAAALVHICFAFPMLTKLLRLLLLTRTSLFMLCTALTFGVFALVYVVIYSVTAKTNYKIVH